jgi:hypothetical protein
MEYNMDTNDKQYFVQEVHIIIFDSDMKLSS